MGTRTVGYKQRVGHEIAEREVQGSRKNDREKKGGEGWGAETGQQRRREKKPLGCGTEREELKNRQREQDRMTERRDREQDSTGGGRGGKP